MNVLVTGGSASGKSLYAEQLACHLSPTRIYLATMSPEGDDAQRRIARHRAQRADGGFATIECNGTLPRCRFDGVVLLDDLGNLVAQALFAQDGTMADPSSVLDRLDREVAGLFGHADHVMGSLACKTAARADAVVEVTAGIPCLLKGALPC